MKFLMQNISKEETGASVLESSVILNRQNDNYFFNFCFEMCETIYAVAFDKAMHMMSLWQSYAYNDPFDKALWLMGFC